MSSLVATPRVSFHFFNGVLANSDRPLFPKLPHARMGSNAVGLEEKLEVRRKSRRNPLKPHKTRKKTADLGGTVEAEWTEVGSVFLRKRAKFARN
jgi:hypothetical protein